MPEIPAPTTTTEKNVGLSLFGMALCVRSDFSKRDPETITRMPNRKCKPRRVRNRSTIQRMRKVPKALWAQKLDAPY